MKPNTDFLESIKNKKIVFSPYMLAAEISRMLETFLKERNSIAELTKFNDDQIRMFTDRYAVDYVKLIYDKNMNSKPSDPEDIQ